MPIKALVEDLQKGKFDPTKISSIEDLITSYQGKVLIEHVADYHRNYEDEGTYYFDVINTCLDKFVTFLQPSLKAGKGSIYLKDLRMQFIIFLSYIGRRESTAQIKALEENRDQHFPWRRRLKTLLPESEKKEFEFERFQKILREVALLNQIVSVAKGCRGLSDLELKRTEIERLSNDTLFSTHRYYSGWAIQKASSLLTNSYFAVPTYSTRTTSNLTKVTQCLESGGDDYYVKYVAFLMKFYKAFDCTIQNDIVGYLETMITVEADNYVYRKNFNQVMIEHLIAGEIGRETAAPLLAKLSPRASYLLLESLAKERLSSDQRENLTATYITPLSLNKETEFVFRLSEQARANEILLLLIIAAGDFPKLKWINLCLNPNNIQYELIDLRRFVGNPKVVLVNSYSSNLDFVDAFRFACTYSPYPPKCFVNFDTVKLRVKDLVSVCQTCGLSELRFLSKNIDPIGFDFTLNYLVQLKSLAPDFSIYHRIEFNNGESFDYIFSAQGLKPGLLSSRNLDAKAHFDSLSFEKAPPPPPVIFSAASDVTFPSEKANTFDFDFTL